VKSQKVLVIGTSDFGTACALRLEFSGWQVVLIGRQIALDIYHTRTFTGGFFSGKKTINNVTAITQAGSIEQEETAPDMSLEDFVIHEVANRRIPLIEYSEFGAIKKLPFPYIVITDEAIWKNLLPLTGEVEATTIGPNGFTETNLTYRLADDDLFLGRVIYPFIEEDFAIKEPQEKRLGKEDKFQVKAPLEGVFTATKELDDAVLEREEIGKINEIPILSPEKGRLSGILNSGLIVPRNTVFAEIDTSPSVRSATVIPSKYFSLAGGVLEAILYDLHLNTT